MTGEASLGCLCHCLLSAEFVLVFCQVLYSVVVLCVTVRCLALCGAAGGTLPGHWRDQVGRGMVIFGGVIVSVSLLLVCYRVVHAYVWWCHCVWSVSSFVAYHYVCRCTGSCVAAAGGAGVLPTAEM